MNRGVNGNMRNSYKCYLIKKQIGSFLIHSSMYSFVLHCLNECRHSAHNITDACTCRYSVVVVVVVVVVNTFTFS